MGPIFISLGDATQLQRFCNLNPTVACDMVLVEDYNLQVYQNIGLDSLGSGTMPKDLQLQAPTLNAISWWQYLTNVMSLSPMPSKTVTNEQAMATVSQLGGTFVVNGNNILFQQQERIPGDAANLTQVMSIIRAAAAEAAAEVQPSLS